MIMLNICYLSCSTTPNNIGQSDDATATTAHVTDTNVKPNSATVKGNNKIELKKVLALVLPNN